MAKGTVSWVDSGTGHGFIAPEEGGKDLFVHPADITGGSKTLVAGASVEFGRGVGNKGRIIATNIVLAAAGSQNGPPMETQNRMGPSEVFKV